MKNLRRNFERFCYKNRGMGIPNLMLYVCIGNAVVYLMSQIMGNYFLYALLYFDRALILRGQVWRLISYPLTMYPENILFMMISLICYYSLGNAIEHQWGTLKFNLFYLGGILMMDIYSMIFGCQADVYYLNMSLFLSFATMYPNAGFLLFFVIPVKAWVFALFDMAVILIGVFGRAFPYNVFPIIALANYFLFFGSDVLNVFPMSWRVHFRRLFKKTPPAGPKVIQFTNVPRDVPRPAPRPNYTHRCDVCGRTDVSNPELEFRYCSKCSGYHCYCQDHISNHAHIQ